MKKVLYIALLMLLSLPLAAKGGERSPLFKVTYGRKTALVHQLKVSPADSLRRMRGMDDKEGSAAIFEMAAFATFDIAGPTQVTVKVPYPVQSVKVLPSSRGIEARVKGKEITLEACPGDRLTVEVNGQTLERLNELRQQIERSPIVDSCAIVTANKDARKAIQDGVWARFIVYLQKPDGEITVEEVAGDGGGNKLLDDMKKVTQFVGGEASTGENNEP